MSDASLRRTLRLEDQLNDLKAASKQASRRRIMRGGRRWVDIDHALGGDVPLLQQEVMAALPVCVARRAADPELGYWRDGTPLMPMMLAHPPGEPPSDALQCAVEHLQTRWRTEPKSTYRDWVILRLVFGADGGEELRQRCWTVDNGGWVLSDEVVDAANRTEQTQHLGPDQMLISPEDARRLEERMQSFNPAIALFMLSALPTASVLPSSLMTPLELAVLIDPNDTCSWLPPAGWAALSNEPGEEPTSSPTAGSHSAVELALARTFLRGTAKFWHGRDDAASTVQEQWLADIGRDEVLAATEPT